MNARQVGWSLHRDPDLIIDIWSTAALTEAVLEALLGDPLAVKQALEAMAPRPDVEP